MVIIIIVLIDGITNLVNEGLQLFAVDLAIAIGIKQLEGLLNAVMKMFAIERRDGIDQDDETSMVWLLKLILLKREGNKYGWCDEYSPPPVPVG